MVADNPLLDMVDSHSDCRHWNLKDGSQVWGKMMWWKLLIAFGIGVMVGFFGFGFMAFRLS